MSKNNLALESDMETKSEGAGMLEKMIPQDYYNLI